MLLRKGRYRARLATTPGDVGRAQRLRHTAFKGRPGSDRDAFDADSRHVLVEDDATAALVACFRVRDYDGPDEIGRGYAAQFYALAGLRALKGPMLEMGRFCIRPGRADPDIVRVAWGALTQLVDARGVQFLFGCSSFPGAAPERHRDALALLSRRHLAPVSLRPGPRAARVFPFAHALARGAPDPRRGMRGMPPLLRSYLMMGGWVSDHAVIDLDLDTLHVFTGLEIAAIPERRRRLLRSVAAPGLDAEPAGG